jgi:hypothetical protein
MRKILLLILLLILIGSVFAESFYPTTIGSMNAEAKLYGRGTISGLGKGESVTFQTLTFQESEFQKTRVIKEALYINGETIYPKYTLDEFANKYAVFTIKENGEFNYELIADINTHALMYAISDYNINPNSIAQKEYLVASDKIESNTIEIETVEKNKLITNSFLDSLNKTILWVNDYVEYPPTGSTEFNKYYLLQRSAIDTLESRKGVCDEFANLAASLLRAKKIPTRIVTGITFDGQAWGNHAWIEVYNETLKVWIPSDPTFRETGFVDATHIKIGSYQDVTQSLAKAFFPETANVSFNTQTVPEVTVKEKKYLNQIKIRAITPTLEAKKWNKLELSLENLTNSTIIAPINIRENYTELIIPEKKQSVILKPGETKTIFFDIYPNVEINENQIARGTITFNSLSPPFTKEFQINYTKNTQIIPEVKVEDITPIINENNLTLRVITTNYTPRNEDINISVKSETVDKQNTYTLNEFESKLEEILIPDYNDAYYTITINTPSATYEQTIVPAKQKNIIKPIDLNTTAIVQVIDHNQGKSMGDVLTQNPMILMIALLMGIGVMLFGLFWVNQRYV